MLGSPQLWCDIVTGIHGTKSGQAKRMLELWASRARDAPLSIQHTPQIFDGLHILLANAASGTYEKETTAFVRTILHYAKQLKTLALNVLNTDVLEPVSSHINIVRPPKIALSREELEELAPFPLLEELDLSSTHLGILADEHTLESIDLACPRLQTLSLLAPAIIPGAQVKGMHSMRTLNLKFVTAISHCLRWLRVCPNIESLSVGLFCREDTDLDDAENGDWLEQLETVEESELSDDDEGWVLVPQPPRELSRRMPPSIPNYRLHNLTRLALWVCGSPGDLAYLLSSIEAPGLRTFAVATSLVTQSDARWPSVLDFVRRCQPRLEEFECSGTLMTPEDVCAVLALLKDLRALKIGKSREVDAVLYQMVATPFGEVLCPQLEELNLEESNFSIEVLGAMVYSRCDAVNIQGRNEDAPPCVPLKRLKLDKQDAEATKGRPVLLECISRGLRIDINGEETEDQWDK